MVEKSCYVKFVKGPKGIEVKFTGMWNRADVEKAYGAMYRELASYLVKERLRQDAIRKSQEKEVAENE